MTAISHGRTGQRVVVIGGGQAGAQACQSLRAGGLSGRLTLLCEEPDLPYQRPPLSKAYMKGDMPAERLLLRPERWYRDQQVDVRQGVRALAIDRAARKVTATDGDHPYDALVLATGSRPRALPIDGATLPGVFSIRTRADVDAIRNRVVPGRKVVIIGAGYIGLEAAAVARQQGLDVTVVEQAGRILARVTSPQLSTFFEDAHRRRGVRILTGTGVDAITGEGEARGVRLTTGETLHADLVIVGIGIVPNTELAEEAGLECRDGIVVDGWARTSDPAILAIGDCARRPLFPYGGSGRLESVHNAIEQGKIAAAAILGQPSPTLDCPWFWSDQYDLKLQIAGLSQGHDDVVLRGDPSTESFAAFYFREGRLVATDAVNDPVSFLASKKMIIHGARPDRGDLSDPHRDLKTIAAEAIAAGGA